MRRDKWKIQVHETEDKKEYTLRLYVYLPRLGHLRFESDTLSKPEADCRAMEFSSFFGCQRDKLPTHGYRGVVPEEIRDEEEK